MLIYGLLLTKVVHSQNIDFYPTYFGTTPQTLSLTNPVYLDIMPFQGLKIGTQTSTGAFKAFRTLYTQGIGKFQQRNNNHWFGADFISEQEGPAIRRNRMRFNYALQKEISNHLFLSLGTHLGLASFDYNGKKAVSQGSSIGPDGSIAFLVKYKNWRVVGNINQFFDQVYKPKTITFNYPTYYGYYFDKTWEFASGSQLCIYHLNQIIRDRANIPALGFNYTYREVIGGGIIYHRNYFVTTSIFFDIQKGLGANGGLRLYFSYNSPIQKLVDSGINTFEMGLTISFKSQDH